MNCIPFIRLKNTCVVDKDIDSTKDFDGFLDKKFTVQWLSEIGVNIMGLDVGVGGLEMFLNFFEVFLGGETIEDDVKVSLGKGIGNTESDTAQWSSDDGDFVGGSWD